MYELLSIFVTWAALAFGIVAAYFVVTLTMREAKVDVVLFRNQSYGVRRTTRTITVGKYIVNKLSLGILCDTEEPRYEYLTRSDNDSTFRWANPSFYTSIYRQFPTKEAAELALYEDNIFGENDIGVAL